MFEMILPAIDLTEVSHETIMRFAEKHGDQFTLDVGNEPDTEEATILKTVTRVIKAETGLYFKVEKVDEGFTAVYVPDIYNGISYDDLCEKIYPYIHELGRYGFDRFEALVTPYNND